MRTSHGYPIMISNYFNTNHRNRFRLCRIDFPGIIEEPGSLDGNINSPYPALGPEPKNLMSLAIFIRQTAVVLSVPEKFTISS